MSWMSHVICGLFPDSGTAHMHNSEFQVLSSTLIACALVLIHVMQVQVAVYVTACTLRKTAKIIAFFQCISTTQYTS